MGILNAAVSFLCFDFILRGSLFQIGANLPLGPQCKFALIHFSSIAKSRTNPFL